MRGGGGGGTPCDSPSVAHLGSSGGNGVRRDRRGAAVACTGARHSPTVADGSGDAAVEAVELLADGEDLELVENDLEFYEWLDATGLESQGSTG